MKNQEAVDNLRKFIKDRRVMLKMRQRDLAEKAKVSLAWVGMLESRRLLRAPRENTLQKMARALILSPESYSECFDFMSLILAGHIKSRTIVSVANGNTGMKSALDSIADSRGVSITTSNQIRATKILYDSTMRSERMCLVTDLLKADFTGEDLMLASRFIQHMYELPIAQEPIPQSAPRP